MEESDDLIPLSALQHYLYCPRQCALIHVERLWAENRQTAEGRLLHDRADKPQIERRHGVRTITAMPLSSAELGITGVADVVESRTDEGGERPFPVEYKRGRPKAHRADEVQLCAQALCLEAMFGCKVEEGALFYGQTRRRQGTRLWQIDGHQGAGVLCAQQGLQITALGIRDETHGDAPTRVG